MLRRAFSLLLMFVTLLSVAQTTEMVTTQISVKFVSADDPYKALLTSTYHAVIIANQQYTRIEPLTNPIPDANKLKEVLVRKYGFAEKNVNLLYDVSRDSIVNTLSAYKKGGEAELTENDNLLVFYTGHGLYDPEEEEGFWLGVDSDWGNPSEWVSNARITTLVKGIKARHTLLISDACFSGSIFRSKSPSKIKTYSSLSRRAITSGNLDVVPDNGVFIKYLVLLLEQNDRKYLSSQELFVKLKDPVANNSENVPRQGVLFKTGDMGGDFIFRKEQD